MQKNCEAIRVFFKKKKKIVPLSFIRNSFRAVQVQPLCNDQWKTLSEGKPFFLNPMHISLFKKGE